MGGHVPVEDILLAEGAELGLVAAHVVMRVERVEGELVLAELARHRLLRAYLLVSRHLLRLLLVVTELALHL